MKKLVIIGLGLCACAPLLAVAQDDSLPRIGGDTRAWLALQTSPTAQVTQVRAVPGEVAEQVYQRYINSFKYPIPETFKRDSFVESGGGGGGGGK